MKILDNYHSSCGVSVKCITVINKEKYIEDEGEREKNDKLTINFLRIHIMCLDNKS